MKKNKIKVGIVTITNDGYNFGNRLQNYALQTVLERMGFQVETLNRPIRGNQRDWWKSKRRILHYLIPIHQTIEHLKSGNFFIWNNHYINWSPMVVDDSVSWEAVDERYDLFVAGSDQIWNPNFPWGKDPYMFLQFANSEKRIAYAPSIGIGKLDIDTQSLFKSYWDNWKSLSCREFEGARIMSESIGGEITCLLDPTLLLSAKDWRHLTRFKHTPRKYIFLYILGDLTEKHSSYINELSHRIGCQIVDVIRDKKFAGSNPSQFVALIQHSEWVVADSFHAFVFSMIFHKRFTYLDRVGMGFSMNSRITTLCQKFNIQYSPQSIVELESIDWQQIDSLISQERQMSYDYLISSLK